MKEFKCTCKLKVTPVALDGGPEKLAINLPVVLVKVRLVATDEKSLDIQLPD